MSVWGKEGPVGIAAPLEPRLMPLKLEGPGSGSSSLALGSGDGSKV